MKAARPDQQAVEETLASINNMNRAEAPPFFFTRLQARLEKTATVKWRFLVNKPVLSLAMFTLLLLLNMLAIDLYSKKEQPAAAETGIQKFAQEYNLSESSVYHDKPAR